MAFLLSGERSTVAAASFSPFKAIANWFGEFAQARRKRAALLTLLAMDDDRLHDFGISRHEIIDALKGGPSLTSCRAENARPASRSN